MGLFRQIVLTVVALGVLSALPFSAAGQDEEGYNASVFLLQQASRPYADRRDVGLLKALYSLDDPWLVPYYKGLSRSPSAMQRVYAQLGQARQSPKRRIDLASAAEIKDEFELVTFLSLALDQELIDNEQIRTMLGWQVLQPALRMAMAVTLIGQGEEVDPEPYRPFLDEKPTTESTLEEMAAYALAGLILAEHGEENGKAALRHMLTLDDSANFTLRKIIQFVERYDLQSTGEMFVLLSLDDEREWSLQSRSMRTALRMNAKGAAAVWRSQFKESTSMTRRIRLSLLAMDGAGSLSPKDFALLEADELEVIRQMGKAARALHAGEKDLPAVFAPLTEAKVALPTMWLLTYCMRVKPEQSPELLELIIRCYNKGDPRQSDYFRQAASEAVQVLCERYPQRAIAFLPGFLDEPTASKQEAIQKRQYVLHGLAVAKGVDLQDLARQVGPDQLDDATTRAARLIFLAKHDAPLTEKEWYRISDLIQGAGVLDPDFRIQLAWVYLKKIGRHKEAIAQALSVG